MTAVFFRDVLRKMESCEILTLLMLGTEYSGFGGQCLACWCPGDLRTGMVLIILDRQYVGLLHWEFGLYLLNKIQDMILNVNASFTIFQKFCVNIQNTCACLHASLFVFKADLAPKQAIQLSINWLQWIGQRQLQDETRNIEVAGFGGIWCVLF